MSIPISSVDFNVRAGATFMRRFRRRLKTTGALVPMPGYTARFEVRSRRGDGPARTLLEINSGAPTANGSSLTLNTAQDTWTLLMTDEDTAAFEWARGHYTLWIEDAANNYRRALLSGQVGVNHDSDGAT